MKRLHFRALFISVLALCLRTSYAQPPQPKQDVRSAILARRAIWNKAIIERDFDTLAGLATPDFSSIGALGRLDGPEHRKASYVRLLESGPDVVYKRTTVRVEVEEGVDFAHEIGTWHERWTEPDSPTELQGDNFVLWRQIGGEWKEQAEIFAPSRCLGEGYCVAYTFASPAPMKREHARAYAGWYALSGGTVLEIRAEGGYLVAHCPALFGDGTLTSKSDSEFRLGAWTIRFFSSGQEASAESVELRRGEKVLNRGTRLRLNP